MSKVIVVGAGINGVTAAIELRRRGHKITLIDPGPLPHPLAASTDISKAIRTAYGPDEDYSALAERAIPLWRKWNEEGQGHRSNCRRIRDRPGLDQCDHLDDAPDN